MCFECIGTSLHHDPCFFVDAIKTDRTQCLKFVVEAIGKTPPALVWDYSCTVQAAGTKPPGGKL
eukprot:3554081-Prorocentrum_lima.AAC.1